MPDTGDDWKSKYGFEKKVEAATVSAEKSGMKFEQTGEREARLRYFNHKTKDDVRNPVPSGGAMCGRGCLMHCFLLVVQGL
jgi:hypothetical protein